MASAAKDLKVGNYLLQGQAPAWRTPTNHPHPLPNPGGPGALASSTHITLYVCFPLCSLTHTFAHSHTRRAAWQVSPGSKKERKGLAKLLPTREQLASPLPLLAAAVGVAAGAVLQRATAGRR